jgi:5'-3' exonuclease
LWKPLDIPLLILDGYEADDVIGTIAKKAVKANPEMVVYMMTPDKDYGQLVEERIKMYKPAFMGKGVEVLGPKEVCARWNIKNVDQVIDMLGLMGDAVDNIPGIPGVGEKTAQKLLEEYESLREFVGKHGPTKRKAAREPGQFQGARDLIQTPSTHPMRSTNRIRRGKIKGHCHPIEPSWSPSWTSWSLEH